MAIEMVATKTNLNKLITWSSSRYNSQKKNSVIADILFAVECGEDCKMEFRSGCYSEAAYQGRFNCKWSGGEYTLEIKDGVASLYNYTSDVKPVETEQIILTKATKNQYYIPAKYIYHKIDKWGIPVGQFEVIGQDVCSFHINHEGTVRHIAKTDCEVIENTAANSEDTNFFE